MNWTLSPSVSLRNDRVSNADADRQQRTAAEILTRLNEQPGLVLADEVGMGKTYVALAVAVSVLHATRRRKPVVVMVPSAVADKWPTEWAVFAERCLPPGHGLRASMPIRRGGQFLKLLDNPASSRSHLIFLTHGALTSNLHDPFIRLALLRWAMWRRRNLTNRRRAVARSAASLLNDRRFDEGTAAALLEAPIGRWRDVWHRWRPEDPLDDDPVPFALEVAIKKVEFAPLRAALAAVPIHRNATFESRLRAARRQLNQALKATWTASLASLNVRLPLLILDEAHHVKNPTRLARLFDNEEAEKDAEALQGPLGNMFEKMLFLTATPFQLGHHEPLNVLDRFHGVRWPSVNARTHFDQQIGLLSRALDRAQASALRLERAWARIDPLDGQLIGQLESFEPCDDQPEAVRTALTIAGETRTDVAAAQQLLRPWVIRHVKPHKAQRRLFRPGRSILDNSETDQGLAVEGPAVLPFLLAARAQAVATLQGENGRRSTSAYFAYGLASSFEAYAETRKNRIASLDEQVAEQVETEMTPQLKWYLDRIAAALPKDTVDGWSSHPKIAATVHRVRELWCSGEKTLVFCFYVETGRALRAHISRVLRREVISRAAEALGLDREAETEVIATLDRTGERLLRSDSPGYGTFRRRIRSLVTQFDETVQAEVVEVVTRFMRTPSFLVRFVELSPRTSIGDLLAGLDREISGVSLTERIRWFAEMLAQKVEVEREEILDALTGIQTGGIATSAEHFDPSERSRNREVLMPNVRLANGSVRQSTRRRLMLAFNSPFFPEVLVASSVMAEGVDLQRDCRHVIHHDLDWNPSTLEQRTGRIDRIGSKAEAVEEPVVIYEPYLGGTHDEKMFRVVKDRERWFGVVMGEIPDFGERATDRQESRVPLPIALAEQLTMNLSIWDVSDSRYPTDLGD
ncbi:DEAD/DEAH box helicase [Mycolicibacterium elephantis]